MQIHESDLDACFSPDDLGIEAIFDTPEGEVKAHGHFTEGSDAVSMYGVEIEAVEPSITCPTHRITAVRRGNPVEIDGRQFTAERIQKTGAGVTVVYLRT